MRHSTWFLLLGFIIFSCLGLVHCGENAPPQGVFKAIKTDGPKIVFDLNAKPLPEIPLPIDLATRVDSTSPTGLRVNVSMIAPTHLEASVRAKVNELDGFGIYTPISVALSAPLALGDVIERHQKNNDFADDAVYVVCMNPDSPTYGKPVLLDMGRGNFPLFLKRPNNYFDHDPHAGQNNIVFETVQEKDLNHNKKLDPKEDLDHDGVWDQPNTFPKNSTDKDALLNWYERETNTLIMRPVIPLQPGSRYAVILTTRLKGEKGNSIGSPFPWVNHTRQTPVLQRLVDDGILEKLGVKKSEVAFMWCFTTQKGHLALKELRDGLYGYGAFKALSKRYPAKMTKLHALLDDGSSRWRLSGEQLSKTFVPLLGLMLKANKATQDALSDGFSHIDYLISGEFTTPFFLASRDKNGKVVTGADALKPGVVPFTKTHFQIDRNTGQMVVGKEAVPWMCSIPKATSKFKAPFPVVFYGHGYTSGRFEMLGFAGTLAKFGFATCAIEAVGHGVALAASEMRVLKALLGGGGMLGMFSALSPGRAKDLNNDGVADSGGDFWTADVFHTRDIVRQSVLDHMMLIRIMRSWDGKKTWSLDGTGDGKPNLTKIAGDFNGDGVVDMGGPKADYHAWGQSLGGILSAILSGVEPLITSAAPISPGGGLIQLGTRSALGGVVTAVFLRMMGPLVMGDSTADGKMEFRFVVPDVNKKACSLIPDLVKTSPSKNCALLRGKERVTGVRFAFSKGKVAEGDKLVIKNLRSGESRWALVRKSGKQLILRFAIPADALDALERRGLLGISTDPTVLLAKDLKRPEVHASKNSKKLKVVHYEKGKAKEREINLLGDPLSITIYEGTSSKVKETITTFRVDTYFQGSVYKAGTPLFAISEGLGLRRQSPDFRRFQAFSGMILEPGDPIIYAPLYHIRPLRYHYEQRTEAGANVLIVPTLGDTSVPIDTGLAVARAAGILSVFATDPRYPDPLHPGKMLTPNEVLLRHFVVEGVNIAARYADTKTDPKKKRYVLFDPDNLSRGTDQFNAPRLDPPLRLSVPTAHGVAGLRIPYVKWGGEHGFNVPNPSAPFDVNTFMINQVALYFLSKGTKIDDRLCLADQSCPDFPKSRR